MFSKLAPLLLAATLAAAASACATGGDVTPPASLAAVRDSLPIYPGAGVAADGVRPRPTEIVSGGDVVFSYDRIYVAGTGARVSQDEIIQKMTELLQQAGWQQEDPATSKAKGIRYYCSLGYVKCVSFTKDGARAVVSVPIPINFTQIEVPGSSYHTHLEKQ